MGRAGAGNKFNSRPALARPGGQWQNSNGGQTNNGES
jgi:hypothetical protein